MGALGRKIEPTRQHELHRDVPRELPRQAEQRPGGGDEVPLHLGHAEDRRLRGDDEITREHDLGAGFAQHRLINLVEFDPSPLVDHAAPAWRLDLAPSACV